LCKTTVPDPDPGRRYASFGVVEAAPGSLTLVPYLTTPTLPVEMPVERDATSLATVLSPVEVDVDSDATVLSVLLRPVDRDAIPVEVEVESEVTSLATVLSPVEVDVDSDVTSPSRPVAMLYS
jgi:hypothetical protein